MSQELSKPTLGDPKWYPTKRWYAMHCSCCEIGYSAKYLIAVSDALTRALSHGAHRPKVFA